MQKRKAFIFRESKAHRDKTIRFFSNYILCAFAPLRLNLII